jgi:hypothetical protein
LFFFRFNQFADAGGRFGIRFFRMLRMRLLAAARLSASGSCLNALTACSRCMKSSGSAGVTRLRHRIHRRYNLIQTVAFQALKYKVGHQFMGFVPVKFVREQVSENQSDPGC